MNLQHNHGYQTADPLNSNAYSADVRMELHINGHVLPISHLGPDFFVLSKPIDHPPAEAEILMSIDGHESRWAVRLPAGLCIAQRRTSIARG